MSEIKLKPCPFCGSENVDLEIFNNSYVAIVCLDCRAHGSTSPILVDRHHEKRPYYFSRAEQWATKMWNERAEESE